MSQMTTFSNWIIRSGLSAKKHQQFGFKWAVEQESDAMMCGGIIADEMGLGKTILALGLMTCNDEMRKRNLIVLPPALVDQWCAAIKKFCPELAQHIHVWRGKKGTNDDAFLQVNQAENIVVVTTYGMIANRNIANYCSDLWVMEWDRIIYDEAHHLRNHKTNTFLGAKQLHSYQTPDTSYWYMTGTPINNKISDVMNLFRLANVKCDSFEELKPLLVSKVLRRTKQSVGIKMPDCNIHNINVESKSKNEEKFLKDVHAFLPFQGTITSDNVDQHISYLSEHWMGFLTRSRQCCIYPKLVLNALENKVKKGRVEHDFDLNLLKKVKTHSKMTAVVDKIKTNKNGKDKLVFCHFRGEMDFLEKELQGDFTVAKFDGRLSMKERNVILTECPPEVLLIQIQTGCEGLNLQQYSEVYFTSPHWNPAVEEQAIARAHRIGQKQNVDVYRFYSTISTSMNMTIDEYIKEVQSIKRDIAKCIKVNH
jgi:SNF2 family DNA or RNA helicase